MAIQLFEHILSHKVLRFSALEKRGKARKIDLRIHTKNKMLVDNKFVDLEQFLAEH